MSPLRAWRDGIRRTGRRRTGKRTRKDGRNHPVAVSPWILAAVVALCSILPFPLMGHALAPGASTLPLDSLLTMWRAAGWHNLETIQVGGDIRGKVVRLDVWERARQRTRRKIS